MISKTLDGQQQLIDYFVDMLLIGKQQDDSREDRILQTKKKFLTKEKNRRTRHGKHSTIRSRETRADGRYRYVNAMATLADIAAREHIHSMFHGVSFYVYICFKRVKTFHAQSRHQSFSIEGHRRASILGYSLFTEQVLLIISM